MGAHRLDLIEGRLAGGVTGKPLLAGLKGLLGPSVIEVLGDTFIAAELSDAVLATRAFEDDSDRLLGRVPSGGSPDVPDGFLRTSAGCLIVSIFGLR